MAGRRANPPVLKKFGQHFLTDRDALATIAGAVAAAAGETIIEIGPGRGALTDLLAATGSPLIAIEIDRALASVLRKRYEGNANVRIVEADVLETDVPSLASGPFVVAGNVPYYITTPILFHVMRPPYPTRAVFLVQKEVADRMVAAPGSGDYGALSANIQAIASVDIVGTVPPHAFTPPPKVHSSVVRVVPRNDPIVGVDEVQRFRTFVQSLFSMRRKQLGNSLKSAAGVSAEAAARILDGEGIEARTRAESLSPAQLASLMRAAARAQLIDRD
jgi:16S rRNA (adenine1518-N6/adenine1519-N6)-dimethyltransferase